MNIVLTIVAVVAAAVGAGLLWWRSRVGGEMDAMAATQTSAAKDIAGKAAGTLVELKGVFRSDAPLVSEFEQKPCVYYRSLVEREVERASTDSNGRRETKREFETVTDVWKSAPTRLEDASGSVAVDFNGAKVEALQVHRRYERDNGIGALLGSALNVGGLSVGGAIGHRYTEWIIEAGVPVYVLGTALAGGSIGESADKSQAFVISIKSEEERQASLTKTRMWTLVGAIGSFVLAAAVLYGAVAAGP
jgi:hypothetical protein